MTRTRKIAYAFFALALTTVALIAQANIFSVFAQQPGIAVRMYKESKPVWKSLPQAPKGAPNVIYLVLDDVGSVNHAQFSSLAGLLVD